MSIDAQVETVIFNEDGSGTLKLIDRPASPGGYAGCKGQLGLDFDDAPEEVTALNGRNIWGGSGSIVLGEVEIADRIGYCRIKFKPRDIFLKAIQEDNKRLAKRATINS